MGQPENLMIAESTPRQETRLGGLLRHLSTRKRIGALASPPPAAPQHSQLKMRPRQVRQRLHLDTLELNLAGRQQHPSILKLNQPHKQQHYKIFVVWFRHELLPTSA